MSTDPLAPQGLPPAPPRRSSSQAVLIALAVLVLIVALGVIAILIGVRTISRSISIREQKTASGSNEVAINTPAGNLEIHKDAEVDATALGLPIYPGARGLDDRGSARVRMSLPGQQVLGIVAAKFETPDSLDKVKAFYQEQLSGQITRLTRKHSGHTLVFEIKHAGQEKIVALKNSGLGTEIDMVRILHGAAAAN